MTNEAVRVGIIGCGNISAIYLQNLGEFTGVEVVAVADMVAERAAARAAEYGVPKSSTPAELLADPDVELVLNLTIPAAHGEVALAAVAAGKSVYNEKPLAITREDAARLIAEATTKGVRVGCAPDTFLGGGLQTCRAIIDAGTIGDPVAATAFMLGHGPESWHPDPEFFYHVGGGPMFDMGPYYLTALVSLLGPVRRVTGSARASFAERTIGSKAKAGQKIQVEIPTHIAGVLDFAAGPIGTIVTSFDVWSHETPRLEIYGSKGSLSLPDPNTFGGPVRVSIGGSDTWNEVPIAHGYAENSRGIGVLDLARGLRLGRPHRASGELAAHVLDLMHAIHDASRDGRHVEPSTTCECPAALPAGLGWGEWVD